MAESHRVSAPVQRALAVLQACGGRVTLGEVSRAVGCSPSHLSRAFRQAVGATFRACSVRARMEHAAALLREGRRSVKEVALTVGYRQVSAFVRRFTRTWGVTPGAYRRQALAETVRIGEARGVNETTGDRLQKMCAERQEAQVVLTKPRETDPQANSPPLGRRRPIEGRLPTLTPRTSKKKATKSKRRQRKVLDPKRRDEENKSRQEVSEGGFLLEPPN